MPMIIRIDGKAFHRYTRGLEFPWDMNLHFAMTETAKALIKSIQGASLAYLQSDEISVLCTDYETYKTCSWFDKNVQKIASVSASIATLAFNKNAPHKNKDAHFDSRCFVLPREEVVNYFIWRQQDATRNSIASLAQSKFSSKALHGKNTGEMQEMLFSGYGINWNDIETWKKRGWCVVESGVSDEEIPIFSQERGYIQELVDVEEE